MSELADKPVFTTVLRPHRSLKLEGFRLVMAIVAFAAIFASIPFIALGFWPVAGFYGLDVALLYFAFRRNFAEARSFEEITVSPVQLLLRKFHWQGGTQEWRMNPLWTRLHKDSHPEFGVQKLALVSRGSSVTVGGFLSPDEKERFGSALSAALAEARRGPTYDHAHA